MGNRRYRLLFCLLTFALFTFHFSLLNAADPREELKEIQKKIGKEKQKVTQAIKKERSILSELEEIDKTLQKKKEELELYDNRLTQTLSKIRSLEGEIAGINRKLEHRRRFLKERLISLYKHRQGSSAVILISAKDYNDLLKKSRYISFIAYYDRKMVEAYSKEIHDLKMKMQRMAVLKKELEINKQSVKTATDEMEAEKQKKDSLLASVKRERHSYEKMVRELEDSSKRLLDMIKELNEKELSPPVVAGKGFTNLKGKLPWPIDGKILVPFGRYTDPQFNIAVFKNGIEIQAGKSEAARAVLAGKVVYADWFKGYGQLLIINHGEGYHTLYANLSEIFHKVGDTIKEYQPIGRAGVSGILNVPSLYFEIRHKGKPVNPLYWLIKK
ncbi:MAG: peptidoglycan DD-metalloendopeptidase family protein [Nitrospirae bacterium]|nr:peptidoglycan DD-metalloendopeptidase family protein [Nitrospirota bacterium]